MRGSPQQPAPSSSHAAEELLRTGPFRGTPQRDVRLETDEELGEEPRLGKRPDGVPERLQRLPDGAHVIALRPRGRRAPP